jgi:hypothetical protein
VGKRYQRRRRGGAGSGRQCRLCPTARHADIVEDLVTSPRASCTAWFFADKIPGVDGTWDALHTFVGSRRRVLAAGAVGDVTPALAVAAGLSAAHHRRDARDEGRLTY